jgi:spore coat protein U-like protein
VKCISVLVIGFALIVAVAAQGEACSVTTSPAHFGNYDPTASVPLDAVGNVSVTCDSGAPFTIKLDPGQNPTGGFDRRMRSSAGDFLLDYNLYRDSARTEIWGDGTGSTFIHAGVGTGIPAQFNIYGRIPGRQNVRADTYHDAVVVTVEW